MHMKPFALRNFNGGRQSWPANWNLDKDIKSVMVALDIREETVAEAIEKGVDLIIASTRRFSVPSRIW